MKILILGPISTAAITPYLYEPPPQDFPAGSGGAPLMATLIGELIGRGHEVSLLLPAEVFGQLEKINQLA